MSEILSAALAYQEMGLSVIPVKADKKPYIKWEPYQKKKAGVDEIRAWFEKWPGAGVGIVTGVISGLDVIDVDSLDGEALLTEALGEDAATFSPPIARTPRGGKHLYCKATGEGNKTGFLSHVDYRGQGGYVVAPPSRGPNGKGYAWVQDASLFDLPLPAVPASLLSIIKNSIIYRGGEVTPKSDDFRRLQVTSSDFINFNEGHRDNALFHLANHLVKGGMPLAEIQIFLSVIAKKLCNPPYPEKDIGVKIQSALNRAKSRERNISREVREWISTSNDYFLTSDVYRGLQLTSRDEQKACVLALLRIEKEGSVIEKCGGRGGYRKIDSECEVIDWKNADESPAPVKWPFGIERLALLYPKNIVVIAGVQNAGKTALALNLALMNKDRFKVRYLSSEMGGTELKGRLQKFDVPLSEWDAIDFRERSSNFPDVIDPDAFNIIDYYEIASDFWNIGGDLKHIYEKLNNGIAVVCLQKSPDKDSGRGGDFSKEKPRLYLTVDQNPPDGAILTIRKAKAWAVSGKNPNGQQIGFKVVEGCKLLPLGDWKSS